MRRRRLVLVALAAALVSTATASAGMVRVQPHAGEIALPLVRAGHVQIPRGQRTHRVRVIATLELAPLAAARGQTFSFAAPAQRLNVAGADSKAYLARVEQAQRAAIAQLHRAIPSARVQHRYRVVLDGLALSVPAARLPALRRLGFVKRIYPSLQYTQTLNRSPGVIGAPQFSAATGMRGDGIKIGVVDDGIDSAHRFFNPTGYQYPPGFPKGGVKWTTPKVIVARAYPGPGSGRPGRLPVDPRESFHATHVAGIAAGDAGTDAPAGRDHPFTRGLSGVAPRAYLGNYRVFNAPTPIGNVANTPEIIKAFEDAVTDGMDVINFSGGGPQTDPINDAMYETVANVAAAGVVPVISAGNDRGDFGFGTAGSPGTAPDAIAVAAVSNAQVFSPALVVTAAGAPASVHTIPYLPAGGASAPREWIQNNQTLVDIGTLVDKQGKPVDRKLCGTGADPSGPTTPLSGKPLAGAIALVSRGDCTFVSKAGRAQAAGAIGIVVVDNRSGEANPIPITLQIPGVMIADVDGAALRGYMASTGGRTTVRLTRDWEDLVTGRSGVVTSFSSAGPTAYEHALKPDVSAPGGAILSSTLRNAGGPFAVFDGTSMAAPHVSGAAALLVQRHPAWSAQQVKSALMSTAGAAWADTARTTEASVLLEGAGLVNIGAADNPRVFTNPASLSFGDLKPTTAGVRVPMLLSIQDDGGAGAGTWAVQLAAQSASSGAFLELPPLITVPPGGATEVSIAARAAADAVTGDNYGFVILRQGAATRRIPYAFFVSRPALPQQGAPKQLKRLQVGTTRYGASRVNTYRFPTEAFGPPPSYTGPPMDEEGAERTYVMRIDEPVVNFGAAVEASSAGSLVDPWLLGSLDENDVQGYAGTPVNVNSFTLNYQLDVGAAGAVFPRPKTYYFSVDSPKIQGRLLGGRYLLRSWVDDVRPPSVTLVTKRVAAGRPAIIIRTHDPEQVPRSASGVDPTSLVLAYRGVLVGASAYDTASGTAVFLLPAEAPPILTRRIQATLVAADYQESKNVTTPGGAVLPNTTFRNVTIRGVSGPAATWLFPRSHECVPKRTRLVVAASATTRIRAVRFLDGRQPIATVRRSIEGLYATTWSTTFERHGRHVLRAVVLAGNGRYAAERAVRVCR